MIPCSSPDSGDACCAHSPTGHSQGPVFGRVVFRVHVIVMAYGHPRRPQQRPFAADSDLSKLRRVLRADPFHIDEIVPPVCFSFVDGDLGRPGCN